MIKLKPVRQTSGLCGPSSLSSLLAYYGIKKTEKELAVLCGSTAEAGTEPKMLVKALKTLGLKVKASENGTWEDLKLLTDSDTPVLVNWWSDYGAPADGHYSVIYRVTDKSIFLMDPELGGVRRMTKGRFLSHWYDFYASGRKNDRWYLYISSVPWSKR